jgi:type IV pilus assembly protein PilO
MTLDDFNNIDPENYGNWPVVVKAVVIMFLCVLLAGAGGYLITKDQLAQLDNVERQESSLRDEFEKKQRQANSLDKLKEQLQDIKDSFGELLKRLPGEAEIPGLVIDISETGLASGLQFEVFKPEPHSQNEFYVEVPIQLVMTGTYHAFGKFVSDIAELKRIVTQHNINIRPIGDKAGQLQMTATAKTYYYIEDDKGGEQ